MKPCEGIQRVWVMFIGVMGSLYEGSSLKSRASSELCIVLKMKIIPEMEDPIIVPTKVKFIDSLSLSSCTVMRKARPMTYYSSIIEEQKRDNPNGKQLRRCNTGAKAY